VATSAYQIEGGWNEDGSGPSIWDTFSHIPGRVKNNENGDIAADHYHRWKEDIALMSDLGIKAYRFSTSWSRILPEGAGRVNRAGLAFYDRLVDELLRRGIEPYACLFHYDLPQALQDKGGWPRRETSQYFADYACVVAECLGDRVNAWFTHNEPWVTAFVGHLFGSHAPGQRSIVAAVRSMHHVLLSHGLAVDAIRAAAKTPVKVGITLNLSPVYPASGSSRDAGAARRIDSYLNRIVLDPLLKGTTPLQESLSSRLLSSRLIQDGDLQKIHQVDLLGVNYYSRSLVKHSYFAPFVNALPVKPPAGSEFSEMWEIFPQGMYDILSQVWEYFLATPLEQLPNAGRTPVELMVTENGIPVPDVVDAMGVVCDEGRIRYLQSHLAQVHRAMQDGIPVKGYFHWSFIDNFEWDLGYDKRFGLVYVDFKTQQRILKESARWFAKVIQDNAVQI
jgi:beta-glucosidase